MQLAAFVAATQQNHDASTIQPVVNPQPGAVMNPQFRHATANRPGVAKISRTHPSQTRVHHRLHSYVTEGIKPFIERDPPVLQHQLFDNPFAHFQCNL